MDQMTVSGELAEALSGCKPGDKVCVVIGAEPKPGDGSTSVGIDDLYKMDGDYEEGDDTAGEGVPLKKGHRTGVAIILGGMK